MTRDLEVIDSELRLIAAVLAVAKDHGARPSTEHLDSLLDERKSMARREGGERR